MVVEHAVKRDGSLSCGVVPGLFLAILAIAGCERTGQETGHVRGDQPLSAANSRPNIILITVCTCRYDHLSAAGYPRPTTPFLDSLANDGVFFENMVSASSWTKPAVASILTGFTPNVHRMTDSYDDRELRSAEFSPRRTLSSDVVTLAECLREAGYVTGYLNNNIHAGKFFNMTQGFDETGFHDFGVDTQRMVNEFTNWVRQVDKGKPFFFFMLTRDPHITYDPRYEYYRRFDRSHDPVPQQNYHAFRYARAVRTRIEACLKKPEPVADELKQRWIDLYDAELAQLDDALRRIPIVLEEVGRKSNTIIVFTADHGERFFDGIRKGIGHSADLDEPVLRVPLIVWGPGIPGGKRVDQVVRSIDIYSTLVEFAQAEAPDMLQGMSLLPLILNDPQDTPPRSAFSSRAEAFHTVRYGNYKLYYQDSRARALYDLDSDPGEAHSILDAQPEVASRLEQRLLSWLEQERVLRDLISEGQTRKITPEVMEQLRSLGYVE